jgi:hypothetical protein
LTSVGLTTKKISLCVSYIHTYACTITWTFK